MRYSFPTLLVAIWFGFSSTPGSASMAPSNQAEAAASYQALDALARQTRAQGDLPRWSISDHAKVLGRFWDTKATLGSPPYTSSDIPALLAIADRAGALLKTYLLFAPQPGTLPDTAANTSKYQDEVSRAAAYLLKAHAAELEAMSDFVRTLPVAEMTAPRRAGLQQARLGINEMMTSVTLMVRSPGLNPANRDILLSALADNAAVMAAATPRADRAALIAQTEAILPALTGSEREKALAFKSTFEHGECGVLCALEAN
ncbi:MAG: hypothetical protein BGP09_23200 [Rhizobium sp. 60-20]|nr:hypothetical protein [Rhizobium tropici]OJY78835.1 MAG: hypothetical protein BGP09_23200 [Rhizobium sp. 60-20]